ncbi:MAG TPA: S41 family peptidase, partial [Nitrosopumilaceae archaeon]|nr:S41 family peptidase [Nitrosopumilaceae archaeon]
LNGNIGYLDISAFCSLNQFSKETAKAALKMLSSSDAVIIDLRYGLGGSPEMVNYIASAFFKERTHLADIYVRHQKFTYKYWTEPDSIFYLLYEVPLYILTSYKTFSASEGLSYELQKLNRATIIGEVTRGGAHTTIKKSLGYGFITDIPCGRATTRTTHSNWEKKGVIPDINVSADKALETAELKIIENAFAKTKDTTKTKYLNWQFDIIKAINNPIQIDSLTLLSFSGTYGSYEISYSNGSLYYQKTGKAKFPLIPMTKYVLKAKGNDTFKVEFIPNSNMPVYKIITYYDDGRIEYANRSK